MRTLVTGAAGFLGQSVARYMAVVGYPGEIVLTDRVATSVPVGRFSGVVADLTDPDVVPGLLEGVDRVLHLAALPGGAAQADPAASLRINHDVPVALLEALAARERPARFVHAGSIAVFGAPLPAAIDDDTIPAPTMVYGQHKLNVEAAISRHARTGAVDGWALRLPGLVARPGTGEGLKSAFMSGVFTALRAHRAITLPVPSDATLWLLSTEAACAALLHGLNMPSAPGDRAFTLPACHVRLDDLVAAIASATGSPSSLVDYAPDAAIEAQFGRLPLLSTARADALGFRSDGTLDSLVSRALAGLDRAVSTENV
uniref:NAD-dependent epimerase/dehydratase family protein n=1 Tax=uncultured Sphingomonas sp. TaxID=158754 RepID=UPI0035CC974B